MRKRMHYRARHRFAPPPQPLLGLEVVLSVLTSAWGAWLLAPWWDTFASSHFYDPFVRTFTLVAPGWSEVLWGAIVMTAGISALVAVAIGDRVARATTWGVLFLLWGSVFSRFWAVDPTSTASPVYGTLATASLVLTLRYAWPEVVRLWAASEVR